jgi:ribonuclease Y
MFNVKTELNGPRNPLYNYWCSCCNHGGLGLLAGKLTFGKSSQKEREQALQEAQTTIADARLHAETLKRDKLLEAKEEILKLRSDFEKESLQRRETMSRLTSAFAAANKPLTKKQKPLSEKNRSWNPSSRT